MIEYEDLLGAPYTLGGRGPLSYDCWGVVIEAGRRMGKDIPDWPDIKEQGDHTHKFVELKRSGEWRTLDFEEEKQPGDIIIARGNGSDTHAGIHLDDEYVLHAASERGGVCLETLTSFLRTYRRATWARLA